MQKFTQKWTLVKFLEPVEQNTEFFWKDWPLHVTLASVFAVEWENNELLGNLKDLLSKQKPISLVAGEDANFGTLENSVQVTLFNKTPELQLLHQNIVDLLKSAGAVFHEPKYIEAGFMPHSTIQKHARLYKSDTVVIDELSIIDMFPNSDGYQRKVINTIKFDV